MQIADNVYRIQGISNQYLIVDGTNLTIIDTGVASNAKKVVTFIQSLGFTPKDLKLILITHSDTDHIGAINSLVKLSGAQVSASEIEADAMRNSIPSRVLQPTGLAAVVFWIMGIFMPKSEPTPVDTILQDGEILPILGGLTVCKSPGHTPGHLSFYLQEEYILFAGDSINNKDGKPIPNLTFLTGDPLEAQKSFDAQMMLHPKVICCGHAYFDFRK